MYKYIVFRLIREGKKTNVWACENKKTGFRLGVVAWYKNWRQYCFGSTETAVFSAGCLADLKDFIDTQMRLRKGGK